MARVADSTYLTIHDAKDTTSPRAGLLTIHPGRALQYEPVDILDRDLPGGPLADLESVTPIPGQPGEFLLLESGGKLEGRPDRRMLVRAAFTQGPQRRLEILNSADIFPATNSLVSCEGLACWHGDSSFWVLIADRGKTVGGVATAPLVFASVAFGPEPGALRFTPAAAQPPPIELKPGSPGSWRACSDLFIDSRGVLWGASTQDAGSFGPFASKVFHLGPATISDGRLRFSAPVVVHEAAGIKIEAIAETPGTRAGLCIGTDDEALGGVWRLLPRSSAPAPAPGGQPPP